MVWEAFVQRVLLVLLSISFLATINAGECNSSISLNPKPLLIDSNNKYGLWPGLSNKQDLQDGQTITGMNEAMELIWQNQNPPDCSKAKYLVATGWYQGFGSEVHFYGVALAMAMDLGRVLLQEGGWTWRYKNEHCRNQGRKSMDCYILPLSKCSIHDAMAIMTADHVHAKHHNMHYHDEHSGEREEPNNHHAPNKTHLFSNLNHDWTDEEDKILLDNIQKHGTKGHWMIISAQIPTKTDVQCYERWTTHTQPMLKRRRGNPSYIQELLDGDDPTIVDYHTHHKVVAINRIHKVKVVSDKPIELEIKHKDTIKTDVIMIDDSVFLGQHTYVPRALQHIVACAKLPEDFDYFWWRSISATYYLRPNTATLALIEQYRDPVLKETDGKCVSMYVRHGDKTLREMKFVPFAAYGQAAATAFKQNANLKKVLFVATEDPKVLTDSKTYNYDTAVDVRISNLTTTILSDRKTTFKPHDLEKALPGNRQMEYFSYLLHLAEEVRCEVNICTIPSNYCRLIDELRGTIGGKANKISIDLSTETCQHSPCFRLWTFGNHPIETPVYDPKTRIW